MKFFKFFLIFTILIIISISHGLAKEPAKKDTITIDVIYFHATVRCSMCLTIEDFINKSILANFDKELKSGLLSVHSIDFLQEENSHYQDDYNFDTQTLVISKKVNGKETKWKSLDKIWDLAGNYNKFESYIVKEIKKMLK
ncbi:MAG: hypothetical protein QG635_1976 [Bacteroidota bacterium]|nr:hypothetical protein [Bacteroidota bacterium]